MAPAERILLTGGFSAPSLCHGVRACNSLTSPIALSICLWKPASFSSLGSFWFSSLALLSKSSFCAVGPAENGRQVEDGSICGLLRKVASMEGWCGLIKDLLRPDSTGRGNRRMVKANVYREFHHLCLQC